MSARMRTSDELWRSDMAVADKSVRGMIGDGLIERMNHAGIRRYGLARIDGKPLPADTDSECMGEDVGHDMVNLRREDGTMITEA